VNERYELDVAKTLEMILQEKKKMMVMTTMVLQKWRATTMDNDGRCRLSQQKMCAGR
jgi:hypothetical protein